MTTKQEQPKPVAGVDTPMEDDLIVQCAGGCGKWQVHQHPRHILGGAKLNPATGKFEDYGPPTEAEQADEVARIMKGKSLRCMPCGAAKFLPKASD